MQPGTQIILSHTGSPFYIRFQEYFHYYKHGNGKSKFAHLLDNKHSIGYIEDILEIIKIKKIKIKRKQNDEYFGKIPYL
jgi:hypothetical protein